ncbi:hypothetical protein THAOC_29786 [Thalassiosira oceanica]|uniref:Uncharacterized protein n=1 Tax=Thalassiosira oceanica TaxID=159749 RepID=K0RBL0_THAOC|nr:hypothetical protein THAOC_29786 [Thalassiosira oceanica]|eukprot:EJK51078.1 hypothetical protein THAOC_29786 [Thalassiosira oceanica]
MGKSIPMKSPEFAPANYNAAFGEIAYWMDEDETDLDDFYLSEMMPSQYEKADLAKFADEQTHLSQDQRERSKRTPSKQRSEATNHRMMDAFWLLTNVLDVRAEDRISNLFYSAQIPKPGVLVGLETPNLSEWLLIVWLGNVMFPAPFLGVGKPLFGRQLEKSSSSVKSRRELRSRTPSKQRSDKSPNDGPLPSRIDY